MLYAAIIYIPFCTLAFGIHGGQGITGINRQVRNLLCAIPFAVFAYSVSGIPLAIAAFILAYIGVSMGFTKYPLWLKGLVTCLPFGAVLLPLAYYIGDRTPWKNVTSEYLSGTFYGLTLCLLSFISH